MRPLPYDRGMIPSTAPPLPSRLLRTRFRILAALLLLALTGGLGCGDQPATAEEAIFEGINDARDREGLNELKLDPILTAVAQQRADAMAAAGSVDSSSDVIQRVSRELLSRGYAAATWRESALLGHDPRDGGALATWRRQQPENWREMALGDFTDLGVGRAEIDGTPLVVLLFAIPKRVIFDRESAALHDLAAVRAEVLAAVNEERARARRERPPLYPSAKLDQAAQARAEDMAQRGYFAHEDPDGQGPDVWTDRAGYHHRRLGENLAKGLFSPRQVVERWMDSSGHRQNILFTGFEETGLGVAFGEQNGEPIVVWVQLFGAPR